MTNPLNQLSMNDAHPKRPLSFDIYDLVAAHGAMGHDPSLKEITRRLNVSNVVARAALSRMVKRGILDRMGQGIYRLPQMGMRP